MTVPAVRHRVAGVDDEVDQDLVELARIRPDVAGVGSSLRTSRTFSPMSWRSIGSRRGDGVVEVDHLGLTHLLAAEREQLRRQGRRALGGAADRVDAAERAVGVERRPASAGARSSASSSA